MDANNILMNIYPNTTKAIFSDIYNQVVNHITFMKEAKEVDDIIECRKGLIKLLPILYIVFDFANKHSEYVIHKNEYIMVNNLRKIIH